MDIHPDQARTLAAIVAHGSFEAAAGHLLVTASAVSQRVRALEVAVGRPVLKRTRPVELTASGHAVVRFARQLDMLSADLAEELAARSPPRRRPADPGHQQRFPAHLGDARPGLGGGQGPAGNSARGPGLFTGAPAQRRRGGRHHHHGQGGAGLLLPAPGCHALSARLHAGLRRPVVSRRRDGGHARRRARHHLRPQGRPAGPLPAGREPQDPPAAAALCPGRPRVRGSHPAGEWGGGCSPKSRSRTN